MNNVQYVVEKIEKERKYLRNAYLEQLSMLVNKGEKPTLAELIKCQQLGANFFDFVEQSVGDSGLLGAHENGKWVTGFAETCYGDLEVLVEHFIFLKSYEDTFNGALAPPQPNAYANMQRMVKEYLQKDQWQELKITFESNSLPIKGFNYKGANDLNTTPKWQLITGLITGLLFAILILGAVVVIPNPTETQFFVFRGLFAISLAAIAAIIPGLLNIESRFQKVTVKATGAIAVFFVVWSLNPPSLIIG